MTIETRPQLIKRAVDLAGGEKVVGQACDVTFQAVQHWIKKGRVPPKHIITLEGLSGVTRHEIDPGIYPEATPCTAPKPVLSVRSKKKPGSRPSA